MRTLIYARYSSQLQDVRSIGDQIAGCRDRCDREGWTVVDVFSDAAISGAAGIETTQRPGLHAMLARVERGGIDQVLVDSTSRLARDIGDAHQIRKRVVYAGARIFSLADGEIDAFKGAIKGLIDEQQRVELGHNIRRAQRGRVTEGRTAGGIAYGYRKVIRLDAKGEPIRGLREIDPDQAAIVLRAYRDYAAGRSPRAIVTELNAEGVPPPKRGIWRPSTLIAHRSHGLSILTNPIYVGRILYGRTRMALDPQTRQRRVRKGEHGVHEGAAPHLRIIDDDLWHAVQEQLDRRATTRPERQRRPKHMLSGLGVCGVCGCSWVKTRATTWGCGGLEAGGACTNRRSIKAIEYEQRVLAELKAEMLAPDVVSAYLREYHRAHAHQTAEVGRDRGRIERQLVDATRKVDRMVTMLAEGGSEFAELRAVLIAARDERDRLARELAGLDAMPVLTLHPGLADRYRQEVEELERSLASEETRLEAVPRLRGLIERIVVTPAAGERGVELRVVRHIDEVLRVASPDLRRVTAT